MKLRHITWAGLLPLLLCSAKAADEVDQAFKAQSRSAATKTSVAADVAAAASAQAADVRERVQERERQRAEAARQTSLSEPGTPATRGARASPTGRVEAKPSAATNDRAFVVRESWVLKGEQKSLVVRCPGGAERGYSWFLKTGQYCTPSMTCNSSQEWIHRALC